MNFDNTTPRNAAHEHRLSYYDLYHRARAYGAQAPNASYPPVSRRYEPLDFYRDPKPVSIDRGPQTVEDLVRDGYFAVSKREPETAVIVDRQDMAWLTLDDALTQIREREDIYRKNMLEIEWAKCYAFGELARLGWPASDEKSALYQRRIGDLHADQRAERVRFWNDLSRVRQTLARKGDGHQFGTTTTTAHFVNRIGRPNGIKRRHPRPQRRSDDCQSQDAVA